MGGSALDEYASGGRGGGMGARHGARLYQTVAYAAADAEDDIL